MSLKVSAKHSQNEKHKVGLKLTYEIISDYFIVRLFFPLLTSRDSSSEIYAVTSTGSKEVISPELGGR